MQVPGSVSEAATTEKQTNVVSASATTSSASATTSLPSSASMSSSFSISSSSSPASPSFSSSSPASSYSSSATSALCSSSLATTATPATVTSLSAGQKVVGCGDCELGDAHIGFSVYTNKHKHNHSVSVMATNKLLGLLTLILALSRFFGTICVMTVWVVRTVSDASAIWTVRVISY